MFLVWNMRLDKEFFANITNYQAQVNPNKIKEHFENFKNAYYPHLKDVEKKRRIAINNMILKEAAKGEIKFRVDTTIKEVRKAHAQEVKKRKYAPPNPRSR